MFYNKTFIVSFRWDSWHWNNPFDSNLLVVFFYILLNKRTNHLRNSTSQRENFILLVIFFKPSHLSRSTWISRMHALHHYAVDIQPKIAFSIVHTNFNLDRPEMDSSTGERVFGQRKRKKKRNNDLKKMLSDANGQLFRFNCLQWIYQLTKDCCIHVGFYRF